MEEYKMCTKCGENKLLSEYNKSGKRKDGSQIFKSACKNCAKKYREENSKELKKYRDFNRLKKARYDKDYREKNKAKIAEGKKEYYEDNKVELAEKSKIYREKNTEELSNYFIKYRLDNRDKIINYMTKYNKNKRCNELSYLTERFKQYTEDNPEYYENSNSDIWTYIIKSDGFWKIGKTSKFDIRMYRLSKYIPMLEIYRLPINIERRLHLEFENSRLECGSVERFDGCTELFSLSEDEAYSMIKREKFKNYNLTNIK